MENLHLWLNAIKDKLETVHVRGQKDINVMSAIFNTLDDLSAKAMQEVNQSEVDNQQKP